MRGRRRQRSAGRAFFASQPPFTDPLASALPGYSTVHSGIIVPHVIYRGGRRVARPDISRRDVLGAIASGAALASPLAARAGERRLPRQPADGSPVTIARDERFWAEVGEHYDRTRGIVNLEHGYWGKMARPVQAAYLDATRMVNAQNSIVALKAG